MFSPVYGALMQLKYMFKTESNSFLKIWQLIKKPRLYGHHG